MQESGILPTFASEGDLAQQVEQVAVNHKVRGSSPLFPAMGIYNEHVRILSPLAAQDAEEQIVKKIKELNAIQEEMYGITERRNQLEKEWEQGSKELMKFRGILFDFVEEEKAPAPEPEEKQQVNILLLGLTPH